MPTENKDKNKDLNLVRELFTNIKAQVCSSLELLDEPLRGMFVKIKEEFDTKLAALPPTEQVPASLDLSYQLQSLWSCLYSVNSMIQILNQSLTGMKSAQASALTAEIEKQVAEGKLLTPEAVAAKVTAELEAKTKAGELVPQAEVASLCSAAKTNGLAEGEKKVRDEITAAEAVAQTVGARKTALQTASFPLPNVDEVLRGTDEQFNAAKATAEARLADLKSKGISLNADLMSKVWLAEPAYNDFRTLVESIPALKGEQPFAGAGGSQKSEAGPVTFLV
jgi:hypothetical protein